MRTMKIKDLKAFIPTTFFNEKIYSLSIQKINSFLFSSERQQDFLLDFFSKLNLNNIKINVFETLLLKKYHHININHIMFFIKT